MSFILNEVVETVVGFQTAQPPSPRADVLHAGISQAHLKAATQTAGFQCLIVTIPNSKSLIFQIKSSFLNPKTNILNLFSLLPFATPQNPYHIDSSFSIILKSVPSLFPSRAQHSSVDLTLRPSTWHLASLARPSQVSCFCIPLPFPFSVGPVLPSSMTTKAQRSNKYFATCFF